MQFYEMYSQPNTDEVEAMLKAQRHCHLLTQSREGQPHCGIFNPYLQENLVMLHLHRRDEQLRDLREKPEASLVFTDFISTIPSYWIDPRYGGAATSYYKYAELKCRAEIVSDPQKMRPWLERLMQRFQPEGGYDPLDPKSEIYRVSFETIALVLFHRETIRTKWKLGQNRPPEIRAKVLEKLGRAL